MRLKSRGEKDEGDRVTAQARAARPAEARACAPRDRRLVRDVVAAFDRADRILVPSGLVYEDAGHVLRELQVSRGYQVAGSSSLVNDVLIALSARSVGATVVTSNAKDFTAIREIRPFKLTVVSA